MKSVFSPLQGKTSYFHIYPFLPYCYHNFINFFIISTSCMNQRFLTYIFILLNADLFNDFLIYSGKYFGAGVSL